MRPWGAGTVSGIDERGQVVGSSDTELKRFRATETLTAAGGRSLTRDLPFASNREAPVAHERVNPGVATAERAVGIGRVDGIAN